MIFDQTLFPEIFSGFNVFSASISGGADFNQVTPGSDGFSIVTPQATTDFSEVS